MAKITKVKGRQVFDSRGNPTIEAEVFSNNISATAICPSGASTGSFEAYEKRDIKKPEKAMEVWNLGLISLNENLFLFPLKSLPQNNEKQTPL